MVEYSFSIENDRFIDRNSIGGTAIDTYILLYMKNSNLCNTL